MGVQKEQKSMFSTRFEHREKEVRSLFAAQYWYRGCLFCAYVWRFDFFAKIICDYFKSD